MGFNYYFSNKKDGNVSCYAGSGDVLANRVILLNKIGYCLDDLVVMNQTHSSSFKVVSKEDKAKGAVSINDAIDNVDALITYEKDTVLMVQGADCPLLAVFNQEKEVLAVIHSGWKGTEKGVIPNVLSYMKDEMGCNHENTKVIVSPFAKKCCYEVTEEFKLFFLRKDDAFLYKDNKIYFDLGLIIHEQLLGFGINNIKFDSTCTICGNEYFSYRKEGQNAGRFGLLAWMNS